MNFHGGSWNMLLTEKIRLTSWCWSFIPVFPGFDTSQVVPDFWTINSMEDLQSLSEEARCFNTKKYIYSNLSLSKNTVMLPLFSIKPFNKHFVDLTKMVKAWIIWSSILGVHDLPLPPSRLWPVTCIDSSTITSTNLHFQKDPKKGYPPKRPVGYISLF